MLTKAFFKVRNRIKPEEEIYEKVLLVYFVKFRCNVGVCSLYRVYR